MCGLVSAFHYRNSDRLIDEAELLKVRDAMILRGPDGAGIWIEPTRQRVGLGHRRLSILDVSNAGAQPMATADGKIRITFNGEIYNFLSLRRELVSKGYQFKSDCDTEVIIYLYQEYGIEMVSRLRGMFAFAIWDERKRGMLLARDPFGIKPLYYADDGRSLRAASQVKALLQFRDINVEPDPAGHVGYHLWGHVPEPYTLFKGIRALPAGATCWIEEGGRPQLATYFNFTDELARADAMHTSIKREEVSERLEQILADSINCHLLSDVEIGIFLSAGIDSTAITALAQARNGGIRTITLGFHEFIGTKNDEVPLAERFAKDLGTRHQTHRVTAADFAREYDRLLESMDQPSIDGVNSYFVSKIASESGLKVALSGVGGDEFFAGYPSFHQIPRLASLMAPFDGLPSVGKLLRQVTAALPSTRVSPKFAGLAEYGGTIEGAYLLRRGLFMPWESRKMFNADFADRGLEELRTTCCLAQATKGIKTGRLKVMALESTWYMRNQLLRDLDWASMAHSLEVRTPFIDIDVFRGLLPLICTNAPPTKAMLSTLPNEPLPQYIRLREKTGFSVPTKAWLSRKQSAPKADTSARGWARKIYKMFDPNILYRGRLALRSVVVFRIGQLGDSLVSLPAIQTIRRKHPNQHLVLLTDQHATELGYVSSWNVFEPTKWFDQVIFYSPAQGLISRTLKLAFALRRLCIDSVYCLTPERRRLNNYRDYFFFRYLAGTRTVIWGRENSVPELDQAGRMKRVIPEWQGLARMVGLNEPEMKMDFRLPIPMEERQIALHCLKNHDIEGTGIFVAVGPGSKMPSKRWPIERYAQWGQRILKQFQDLRIVVLGGVEDKSIGESLCKLWGSRGVNLAGELSIYGSAAVLERCALYIGNDTGTMHLMAMVGGECVALFSARDTPGKWEPYGDGHTIFRREVECAGCMKIECPYDSKCMKLIEVEDVFAETNKRLKRIFDESLGEPLKVPRA